MKTLFGAAAVLGALLVLAACPTPAQLGPSQVPGQSSPSPSAGSLTVLISDPGSGTSGSAGGYTITGYHTLTDTFAQTAAAGATSVTINNLSFGEWTVTVDADNAVASKPRIGSGTSTASVRRDAAAQTVVTVYPFTGTGGLALTVNWTGSAGGPVVGTLTPDIGGSAPLSLRWDAAGSTYSNASLAAGYYTLALQMKDSGTVVAGAAERVRVIPGQTVTGTISFENRTCTEGFWSADVAVNLKKPVGVRVDRSSATPATAPKLNFTAAHSPCDNLVLTWYVNGVPLPDTSPSSSGTVAALLPSSLAPGTYRVDALVSTPCGTRGGAASYLFAWKGSGANPPAAAAHAAYFDTVCQVPWIWDGTRWQTFYPSLTVTVGEPGYPSIQAAVNASFPPGYTIKVPSGTYDGALDVTKRVAIVGSGGTNLVNTASQGDFTHLPGVAGITYGTYRPTVVISTSGTADSPLLLKDLCIGPRTNIGYPRPGILLRPGSGTDRAASYSHISLVNVQIVGHTEDDQSGSAGPPVVPYVSANEWGLAVDGSTSIDHLTVSGCRFTDMVYGMIFFNAAPSPSTATNILITDSIFARNSVKGFYAEKLSGAVLSDSSFTDNGSLAHAPYIFSATNAGIDVNLKYGTYSNLRFANLTVTRNGLGSYAGAGLTVKARGTGNDSSSYISNPASLTRVVIEGGTYSDNEVGIRLGEIQSTPPFTSVRLTSPTDVTLRNVPISGNRKAQLLNMISGLSLANQQTSYSGSP